eukprot:1238772-Amphidinium_carterae.1
MKLGCNATYAFEPALVARTSLDSKSSNMRPRGRVRTLTTGSSSACTIKVGTFMGKPHTKPRRAAGNLMGGLCERKLCSQVTTVTLANRDAG